MARMANDLLNLAATALDDGWELGGAFIQEHNLTADESFGLWNQLAAVVKGYLMLSQDEQVKILFRGAASGTMPDDMIEFALNRQRMTELTAQIAKIKL